MDEARLRELIKSQEDYNIEFKTASFSFPKGKVNDYCAALANENGGFLFLGVDDKGIVQGTKAFKGDWNKLAHQITADLEIRIKVYEVRTTSGRVLVFEAPRHSSGKPVQVKGGTGKYRYPIRNGESLDEMDSSTLENIFAEREEDWSADTVEGATLDDLDQRALAIYRKRWADFTGKPERETVDFAAMLSDLQLIDNKELTNAALLLFGTEQILAKLIPDAEIIFEWRNNENDIAYGVRKNWRAGFMSVEDDIWQAIDSRNTIFRYQDGFTQRDIPAFSEDVIREAVVNAFVHRDYHIRGQSIIIKVSPEQFYIENPGRLMPGITLENIFDKSAWRNRRLAESLEKVHIMERSSQGIDKIFRQTIEAGKGSPVLRTTHDPSINLEIPATLKDQEFIDFLNALMNRQHITLSLKEIIELEHIRQGKKTVDATYREKFLDLGIIEKVGQGRGTKYILSRQYYKYTGATGQHTRLSGLPRDVKRNIVIEHLKAHKKVTNQQLQIAMTDMSMREIYRLLKGMGNDGIIEHRGPKRYGYWCLIEKLKT